MWQISRHRSLLLDSIKSGIIAYLLLCFACTTKDSTNQDVADGSYFYVGTYTSGNSEGIYKYQLLSDGRLKKTNLVAKAEDPSFLTKSRNGKYLLAVNETNDATGNGGTITSFAIHEDQLIQIDKKPSGGDYPCFVSCNDTDFILTANYGTGSVGLLKLDSVGKLDGPLDILQHEGKGTHARQDGPHAHSAWFTPSSDEVISVDLGTNELWFSKLDGSNTQLVPSSPSKIAMAPESGPRHLTFHPNNKWIYVINELSSTVTQIEKEETGQLNVLNTASTLPSDYKEPNLCADIHTSRDGKFLYASNRGHNSIVIYQIDQADGSLTLVGHEDVHGDWPRNFTLSPDDRFLLVANERSNNIVSFKRNASNGKLEFVGEVEAPSPVCLLF